MIQEHPTMALLHWEFPTLGLYHLIVMSEGCWLSSRDDAASFDFYLATPVEGDADFHHHHLKKYY